MERKVLGNNLILGDVAGTSKKLMLPADARDKHLYVCGGTGVGKSKFLERLIRQDIANWSKSNCGLMLLDPHGNLYDGIIRWMSRQSVTRPVIPIDLRRDDWVVSYNLLRHRPNANPSVIVDAFVQAMAYIWGQGGTDQTPLFARWAATILSTLYEKKLTLVEALHLLDAQSKSFRQMLTSGLSDPTARRHWREADALNSKDFVNQVSSTVNRLERFVKNEYFRAILGQPDVSLDLNRALDEGAIILVNLSTEGGNVSEEDADTFGSLLLTDLWTAAKARGKRDGVKPFYVYLDEFQNFITPTIAKSLDQARGFGLHFTMSNQFPNQLINQGPDGKRLYDSVMENATTKVVFRLTHEDNLKPMAQWLFRGTMDPDQIKHELYSTKVMEYREELKVSHSYSKTSSHGGASHDGNSSGSAEGTSGLDGETVSETLLDQQTSSSSTSESWSDTESESTTETPTLVPVVGKELSHVQFRSLEEQQFRAMATLFDQQERHCVVRIGDRMKSPVSLVTPTIETPTVRPERVQAYIESRFSKGPFLTKEVALNQLKERENKLSRSMYDLPLASEPVSNKRKMS